MADMDGRTKYRQFGSLLVPETKQLHVQTSVFGDLEDVMKNVNEEYMNRASYIFSRAKQFSDNLSKLQDMVWKGRMNTWTHYFTLTRAQQKDFIDPTWVKPEDY